MPSEPRKTPVRPPMVNSPMKRERVEHRSLEGDRALLQREGPVEDLDRGGNCHQHRQQREDQRRVVGDTHDEHVVLPDEEAEDRDRHRGECDRGVAKDALAAEGR